MQVGQILGCTCPGDVSWGILPGHDFRQIKKEAVATMLFLDGEDQPDCTQQEYVGSLLCRNEEDQPEPKIAQCYLNYNTESDVSV
jgi:hypothetical protein